MVSARRGRRISLNTTEALAAQDTMQQEKNRRAILRIEAANMLASAAVLVASSLLINSVTILLESTPMVTMVLALLTLVPFYFGFTIKLGDKDKTRLVQSAAAAFVMALIFANTIGNHWALDHIRIAMGDHIARDSVSESHKDAGSRGYRLYRDAHIEGSFGGEYILDKYGDFTKTYVAAPAVGPDWKPGQPVNLWVIGVDMNSREWENWGDPEAPVQGLLSEDEYARRAIRSATKRHGLAISNKPVMLELRAKSYPDLSKTSAAGTWLSLLAAALAWCLGWILVHRRRIGKRLREA
jgi:hypothetical protein